MILILWRTVRNFLLSYMLIKSSSNICCLTFVQFLFRYLFSKIYVHVTLRFCYMSGSWCLFIQACIIELVVHDMFWWFYQLCPIWLCLIQKQFVSQHPLGIFNRVSQGLAVDLDHNQLRANYSLPNVVKSLQHYNL